MSKNVWKILSVVFAVAGVLMLASAYLPLIMAMDTTTYNGDKADGFNNRGTPTPCYYPYLYVTTDSNGNPLDVSFIYFWTADIPDNAVISSATLKLYVTYVKDISHFIIVLCDPRGIYPHKPYISGDEKFTNYMPAGVITSITEFSVNKYISVSVSINSINKQGWTKYALSFINGSADKRVYFASADSSNIPKLEVSYSIPQYYLTVKTNPTYCDVTVAGQTKNSGEGGATFYLTAGTYQVTVSKSGYKTKTVTVDLNSDKTITVTLEPQINQYTLTVFTNPNYCNVDVTDGATYTQNSGSSGKCTFTLNQGIYTVTVSKSGYQSRTTTVNLDSDKTITVTLQPEIHTHSLKVYVDPIGATVEVAGQTKIVPSTGFVEFTLEEGTYTVKIYKDGYNTVTQQVNLNQDIELHISLTPQKPEMVITHYMNIIGATTLLLAIPCGIKGWR